MNNLLILLGKTISLLSRMSGSAGATWPGHIALNLNKHFVKQTLANSKVKVIVIAGTNGKTTTTKLIRKILEEDKKKVFQNNTGANLLNGIASTLIQFSSITGRLNYDYAVLEIDENTLPVALRELTPDYLILLNLFRDQLDRYGEVNLIAQKWHEAIEKLTDKTKIIANADDPQIAYLAGKNAIFFGVKGTTKIASHNVDSTYCPRCNTKLKYSSYTFSHLGNYSCQKCKFKRPIVNDQRLMTGYPLPGIYNQYNTHAALTLAKVLNISNSIVQNSLKDFSPAFGRQEVIEYKDKKVQLFLSKNPTSFNESLRTIIELGGKHVLFVLNDRIPDGRDVSWIWDVELEEFINKFSSVTVSGDRTYDMALRIKYSSLIINPSSLIIEPDLSKAINSVLENVRNNEMLYILPTYSAMLEVREILTGKKIL